MNDFKHGRFQRQHQYLGIMIMMFLGLIPVSVDAHKVTVFAWVEGDMVHTESKFSRGKKVNGGTVVVYDLQGNRLLEGKTDAQGLFLFSVPKKAALKVELQAGMGHRAEWIVPAEEMGVVASSETTGVIVPQERETPPPAEKPQTKIAAELSSEDIQLAVERALDKKLKPVIKLLVASREQDLSLSDILGGLGYILGLVGLASYIHFRRKKDDFTGS